MERPIRHKNVAEVWIRVTELVYSHKKDFQLTLTLSLSLMTVKTHRICSWSQKWNKIQTQWKHSGQCPNRFFYLSGTCFVLFRKQPESHFRCNCTTAFILLLYTKLSWLKCSMNYQEIGFGEYKMEYYSFYFKMVTNMLLLLQVDIIVQSFGF